MIEDADKRVARIRSAGLEAVVGNAVKPEVLAAANVAGARDIVLAFPNSFEAVAIINAARAANPSIRITARVHSGEQRERLIQAGADTVINGDEVTAQAIAEHLLHARSDLPLGDGPILQAEEPLIGPALTADRIAYPKASRGSSDRELRGRPECRRPHEPDPVRTGVGME